MPAGTAQTSDKGANKWMEKFKKNRDRDKVVKKSLRQLGWDVLVVWECQTRRGDWVAERLIRFLER